MACRLGSVQSVMSELQGNVSKISEAHTASVEEAAAHKAKLEEARKSAHTAVRAVLTLSVTACVMPLSRHHHGISHGDAVEVWLSHGDAVELWLLAVGLSSALLQLLFCIMAHTVPVALCACLESVGMSMGGKAVWDTS